MTNPQRAVADLQGFPLERTMGTHDTWLGKPCRWSRPPTTLGN
jgi:hypothetical protein